MRPLVAWLPIASLVAIVPLAAQSTFHGDNTRTGVYAGAGPLTPDHVAWKFHTSGPVISSPAVANGVIYVGSNDGSLYAIDEDTGAQRWKFGAGAPVVSSPAVANGLVYFLGSDGTFFALSADSGAVRWRFTTRGERRFEARGLHGLTPAVQTIADPMDLFLSSPAVDQGKVYFGSSDGHVYALDAATGALRWSFATGDIVHASPTIAGNVLYIGSWDSYFYALDAGSGKLKWKFKGGMDTVIHNQVGFQSSAAVVGGVVYVGCRDAHVYAFDAATGRKIWDLPTDGSWVNATPAVVDGVIYVGTADTHRFQIIDARSGQLRTVIDGRGLIFGSAAIAGDLVYFGSFNGRLYAVNRATGTEAWAFVTDGARSDPMHILNAAGGFDRNRMPRVFDNFLDMTVNLARMFSVGAILSSPVIDHGWLFVGSADGTVYALR
jgi:eukaryotic-like serine/threonine-protein kinase